MSPMTARKIKVASGVILLALPMLGAITFSVYRFGWAALLCWGGVVVVSAMIIGGLHLIIWNS